MNKLNGENINLQSSMQSEFVIVCNIRVLGDNKGSSFH
jgi:hypothetical protein